MSEYKTEMPVAEEANVLCGKCDGRTTHKILATTTESGSELHYDWRVSNQLVQCLGCKTVSFRISASDSEDYAHDEDGETVYLERETLYPPRLAGRKGIVDRIYLPSPVKELYYETQQALLAGAGIITGIALRALLEALCKEKNATGYTLEKKIDSLVAKGVLTKARADVLHQVRDLGNNAAHEARPYSADQLSLVLEVVEHLLQEVYVLPVKMAVAFSAPP